MTTPTAPTTLQRASTENRGTIAPTRRLAGLDGLRALAVIAVVGYHLFPTIVPGGFLGVDVFFVISGFLITHLLLAEHGRTGRIRLGRFWARRARRLLPALVAVVLVCSSAAALIGGDLLVGIGRQILGAATFSSNWIAILDGGSYFAADSPDLYRTFWSLAVEEQFYLLWPLALSVLLLTRRRWIRVAAMSLIAACSAVAMALTFVPGADPTRAYFGTDTHSFGLALGTVLALSLRGVRPLGPDTNGPSPRTADRRLLSVGALGLVVLAAGALSLHDREALTYRGGLVVVSAVAAIVIWAATRAGSRLGRMLDAGWLRYIGERSYGIYLWHWPVLLLVTALLGAGAPAGLDARRAVVAGIMLAITAVLAVLSYRFIEQPVRSRGLRASFGSVLDALRAPRAHPRVALVAGIAILCVAGTVVGIVDAPHLTRAQQLVERGRHALDSAPDSPPHALPRGPASIPDHTARPVPAAPDAGGTSPDRGVTSPHVTAAPNAGAAAPARPAAVPWRAPRGDDGHRPLPTGDQITAIGDSVMLASAPELTSAFPGIDIDARVSRQMSSAPKLLTAEARQNRLRPVVVIGLGTNGTISTRTLDRIDHIAGPLRRLVFVTAQAPRGWTHGVNDTLRHFAAEHPDRVSLAEWQRSIAPHLDLLAPDRIHPGSAGGAVYVRALRDALHELVDRPPARWFLLPVDTHG